MLYIDPQQLLDEGYIQEVNRQFFHPLGLALCVEVDANGVAKLVGIIDYRDDAEGMVFADADLNIDKAANILRLQQFRKLTRETALGFWVQPVPLGD